VPVGAPTRRPQQTARDVALRGGAAAARAEPGEVETRGAVPDGPRRSESASIAEGGSRGGLGVSGGGGGEKRRGGAGGTLGIIADVHPRRGACELGWAGGGIRGRGGERNEGLQRRKKCDRRRWDDRGGRRGGRRRWRRRPRRGGSGRGTEGRRRPAAPVLEEDSGQSGEEGRLRRRARVYPAEVDPEMRGRGPERGDLEAREARPRQAALAPDSGAEELGEDGVVERRGRQVGAERREMESCLST